MEEYVLRQVPRRIDLTSRPTHIAKHAVVIFRDVRQAEVRRPGPSGPGVGVDVAGPKGPTLQDRSAKAFALQADRAAEAVAPREKRSAQAIPLQNRTASAVDALAPPPIAVSPIDVERLPRADAMQLQPLDAIAPIAVAPLSIEDIQPDSQRRLP